ncbi:hypothetical protein N780_09390 [Pontibacillus chungwhensis BH030062]|uniref:Uncharacterized protein n=1 Tax=Pontibacillus chungwhensis BH030062 TaxID=1385513 RepID=A0A0A2UT19_9BACI|nr:hypothetical protein [Pontibacillus chungwhensis]KGP89858.1 hypothetical protein N780_09390 [Pontibacillus chungwhensis BH030062]
MVIKNPFMDNFIIHFVCVVAGILTEGVLLIPYIGILIYLKKKREKNASEEIRRELNEEPKIQIRSYMEEIGFGQLGVTENYLFFIPKRKREGSVIVNFKYINYYDAKTVATLTTNKTTDFDGSEESSPRKAPVFMVQGISHDQVEFNYIWITGPGISKANKKLFDVVNSLSSAPKKVHVARKQL